MSLSRFLDNVPHLRKNKLGDFYTIEILGREVPLREAISYVELVIDNLSMFERCSHLGAEYGFLYCKKMVESFTALALINNIQIPLSQIHEDSAVSLEDLGLFCLNEKRRHMCQYSSGTISKKVRKVKE